jgi:hypothetical protein
MTVVMYSVKWIRKRGSCMRVTREQAADNREKVLQAAGTLFRQHGFDGIGVADIMKRAGLTERSCCRERSTIPRCPTRFCKRRPRHSGGTD